MDDAAVARLLAALEQGGPDCADELLAAFEETPTGPVSEIVEATFASWNDPTHLPALYRLFGEGMLQAFGRRENLVGGVAAAVEAMLGEEGDFVAPARDPAIAELWLGFAAARYRREWEVELSETAGPPTEELWKPLARAAYLACLDDPASAPPDPFDPLVLMTGPLTAMGVGTRCASLGVLTGWQRAEPDGDWAGRVRGLTERYSTDLEAVGLELERSWGQGASPALTEPPAWATHPAPPAEGSPMASVGAGLAAGLLLLIVLLARTERGREGLKRGAAVAFGLGLIGLVEVGASLAGKPPGDELRPLPSPRLELDENGYHRDARHRFFRATPAPGRARIAVVGASTVVGPGLAESDTIPGLLRANLRARLDCVDVVNAGAHGVASPVIRSLAVDAVDRLGADAVIVYTGHNDVGMMREKNRYVGALDPWFVPRARAQRTRLWGLLSGLLPAETPISTNASQPAPGERDRYLGTDFLAAVQANFDREMTDMTRALARRGVPLVLVQPGFNHHGLKIHPDGDQRTERTVLALQTGDHAEADALTARLIAEAPDRPSSWFLRSLAREQVGDLAGAEEAIWGCARTNHGSSSVTPGIADTLVRLAERDGVTLVDGHGLLHAASADHLPGFDLFTDYVHLNPRGARVIADGVLDALNVEALRRRCEAP